MIKNSTVLWFITIFVVGILYVLFTYKTPYEEACDLENKIISEMSAMKNQGNSKGIICDSISIFRVKKDDLMCINDSSYVLVDTVFKGYIGVVSPKGYFILSNIDILSVPSQIFKKDSKESFYAKAAIYLELVRDLKEKIKKGEKEKTKKKINTPLVHGLAGFCLLVCICFY